MKIVESIIEVKKNIKEVKLSGKHIGFVPTMGYLHEGHLSLIRRAKAENDFVVVSIFVNTKQFGPNEDLSTYPRDLEKDIRATKQEGVDVLFNPNVEEMYPSGFSTYVETKGEIASIMCALSRPVHFTGVTTVVAKLFNIVSPDRAYFGQKDAQQLSIIEKMVQDLDFNLEIVPCPIVREKDGLAMSSRNTYLSDSERIDALILSKSLLMAKQLVLNGERDADTIKNAVINKINTVKSADIDYVEVVNAKTFKYTDIISGDILIALAIYIGKTRLIDNMRLEV